MGLTLAEGGIFVLGAALIARFLLRAALPRARTRFVSEANRHSDDLREEFVLLPPARIAAVLLVSAIVLAGAALAATRSVAVAAASGAAPVLFAGLLVRWYRNRRKRSILSQLPSLLDLLSGHVRAGHSLSESLAETVPLLPAGIREEMAWVLQQNRLGTPLAEALAHWEERIRTEETSLVVRPLRAAIPGGGNIVDLLERTRDILRLRMRTAEKLRSMTAQARLQALVLTLLPPAFAAALSKVDPGFFPNLIGTPQGKTIVAIAFLLRTWKGRPLARSMQAYRSAHDRLTERLVAKRILGFPGACLVSPLRHWAFAELSALLVFLAVVSGNRSVSGLAQAATAAAPLGFGVAWISLRGAAREALRSVQRDLPVACFLFSLLLESGMGASSALQETSCSIPEGALARELGELVRSRSLGVPRGESIERSRRRVPVEDYRLFLNHVLQGERLGIGLSRSLRELSAKMLESQGHRAETIAQQAAVKMLFPLVVFIFPAVFLIILSPVILGLWDRLAG